MDRQNRGIYISDEIINEGTDHFKQEPQLDLVILIPGVWAQQRGMNTVRASWGLAAVRVGAASSVTGRGSPSRCTPCRLG